MTQGFDIAELERLLERATPGEWESIAEVGVENFANSIYAPAGKWDGLLLARADQNGSTDNAALIVTLHNSAPAMLAEIRELRAENARLKGDGVFLLARLGDLEWHDGAFEQTAREYFGHVEPAIERFRAALGEPQ